jgi:predicted  nucleic acid-binding Zn-ribbon protein
VRIVKANIGLNSDLVGVGNDFQKFIGNVIDYSITKVNNQTKYTNFQTAGVNQQVAGVKLSQALEKLTQEEIVLGGLTELTPLITEEWQQRKELKKSKIEDLKNAVYQANSKLDAQIQRIADTVSGDLVEA